MPVLVRFTAIRSNSRIVQTAEMRAALDDWTRDFCEEVVNAIGSYPPIPGAPNRYKRTGRLFGQWRVRKMDNTDQIKYVIDNPVQDRRGRYYVNYVHGPSGQTSFHSAHGWRNIGEYKDRETWKAGVQQIIQFFTGGSAI